MSFFKLICLIIFVERNLQDIIKEDGTLDSDKRHRLVSLVGAFCHLLKKTGLFPFDLCALFGLVTVIFSLAYNLYSLRPGLTEPNAYFTRIKKNV